MNSITVHTTVNQINTVQVSPNQITVQPPSTPEVVEVVSRGPQGPPGPSGNAFFLHQQVAPSTAWMITHNLNKFPNVVVTDFGGEVFYGLVNHVDDNVVLLSFSAPVSGKAYLS